MRRFLLDCGRSIVAGTALLALGLAPALAEDGAPKSPGSGASAKSSASNSTSGRSGPTQGKVLHSVPEDGMVAEDVPSSSRLVRELIKQHPAEDVIICLAGCRTSTNRVVYAQPAEPVAAKPATNVSEQVSEPPVKPAIANSVDDKAKVTPAAAHAPAAQTDAKPVAETAKPEPVKADTAKAGTSDAAAAPGSAPAPAVDPAMSAERKDAAQPQLVPTMAVEKTAGPAAAGTANVDAAATTPAPAGTPAVKSEAGANPAMPAGAPPAAK